MKLRGTAASTIALLVALPAAAQEDVVELDTITVEGVGEQGFFGEPVALDTGGVLKTGAPIVETPRSVDVVTAAEIARQGATDVEEALSYGTGVQTGMYGLDDRSDWYKIRGFDPVTYHDGLPSRYGYYNKSKPEAFLLDSIEVLRGPASGLYGNGEVGGIVNTTSKVAGPGQENVVQLQFGSYQRKQIGVDWGGALSDDVTWRVLGLVRESETPVDHSQNDAVALQPSLRWQIGPKTELTILGSYQKNDASPLIQFHGLDGTLRPGPEGYLGEELFVGEPGLDRYESEQAGITADFSHRFNATWTLDVTARYSQSEADYDHAWWAYDNYDNAEFGRYNPDGTINRSFYKSEKSLETFGVDARATAEYAIGEVGMETLFGALYSQADYDDDSTQLTQEQAGAGPIDPYDPDYTGFDDFQVTDLPTSAVEELTIYTQNRAEAGRFKIDTGLAWGRVETGEKGSTFSDAASNAEDDEVVANAALLYSFDNGMAPYVSYAESFRQEALGTDAEGDTFDPTRGDQYEVGLKYQPVGTNHLFSVAAFDLTKSNLTVSDPGTAYQVQTGEAEVRGIELEVKSGWRDYTVDAGFTLLDHENENGDPIATVPDEYGSIWLGYEPTGGRLDGFRAGLGARYSGPQDDGLVRTPSHTLVDAMVGYSTERYDVTFTVRNLEDEDYLTYCGGASLDCYVGKGRTAMLTASAKF